MLQNDVSPPSPGISRPLPGYPRGLVVIMYSGLRYFLIYRWEDVDPGGA